MSVTDGYNPQFPGAVTALGFVSSAVANGSFRGIVQRALVRTNGTTEVDVFAAANPFSGTFMGARITPVDDLGSNITLQHTSAGTVVFTIAKGSQGAIKGTTFAFTPFAAGGTATVKSSVASANAVVEIDFIVQDPRIG